ncbi:MAG TPA: hypothetical protein VJK72_01930 [Candidatus Nanoarchaeia archaeon]|nr:hypothetical protein [Candidatus Nanoarchaeia archaeon]
MIKMTRQNVKDVVVACLDVLICALGETQERAEFQAVFHRQM